MIMAPIDVSVRWFPRWSVAAARISSSPAVTVARLPCSEILEPESSLSFPEVAVHGPDSVIAPAEMLRQLPDAIWREWITRLLAASMTIPSVMLSPPVALTTMLPDVTVLITLVRNMKSLESSRFPLVVVHGPDKNMDVLACIETADDEVHPDVILTCPPAVKVGLFVTVSCPAMMMARSPVWTVISPFNDPVFDLNETVPEAALHAPVTLMSVAASA